MGRRNASGATLLGALFIVGLVGWVLSQVWVYLVVGGAIALIGWIAWVLARNLKLPSATPRMVATDTARAAPLPEEKFRALLSIDPNVFDDSVLAEAAALKIFAAWTRDLPMAPADPSDAVRSLTLRIRHIGRMASEIARRQVVWQEASYSGSAPATAPRLTAESLDPWSLSAEALRSASQYVASCVRCSGDGETACESCGGTTKVQCNNCHGAGKAYGYTSNGAHRLLNCKTCKAKGELHCTSCAKGNVTCAVCHGTGRIERWIEIVETVRGDVQIEPDGQVTSAFQWGVDGKSASRAEVEADAKIVYETRTEGTISRNDLARAIPAGWVETNWSALDPALEPGERVRAQSFWLLEVPTVELSYSLANRSPTTISFEGRRMLAPPSSLDQHFAARARRVRLARWAAVGIAAAIPIAYLLRGSYYWSGWVGALALCVVGLAIGVEGFVQQSTLGRRSARRWAIGVAAAAVLSGTMAVCAEPSVSAARRYVAAGQLDRAGIELNALRGPVDPARAAAWAELRLARALKSDDVSTVANEASEIPADLPQRSQANRHLQDLVEHAVSHALSIRQPENAEAILVQARPALNSAVAELSARVEDERFSECATDACRWQAAARAQRASSSAARAQRLTETRAKLMGDLALRPAANEAAGPRVQQLNALLALAKSVGEAEADDTVLAAKAREVDVWASQTRRAIPILGAERAVAADLLGATSGSEGNTIAAESGRVAAYCAMRGGRCAGVYIVASQRGDRVLSDAAHARAASQFLSHAVGHDMSLPDPPKGSSSVTRWREGGVAIAARWRGAELVELRLGDAEP